jgi:acetamidase/formamidase
MDGHGWGEAANDDGSGTGLVMELARVFSSPDVQTDRSIRFALWNNEETGLNGARAYVDQRKDLQGKEDPPGSGKYPEPKWLGMIQHDMMLFDHGMPRPDGTISKEQRPEADVNIEFQVNSKRAADSQSLAWVFEQANEKYATDYPASVGSHMTNTDSTPFQDLVPSISLRENERGTQIGNGWDPQWHQPTDLYATYNDKDFRLGLNAAQTTLAAIAQLSGARIGSAGKVHRLEATPATVSYGYYWSEAKPALRIPSGDIIDVDTLLTSTPERLASAGVPSDKIQASLKRIVEQVTGDKRGPGGHILTGPVYVEGAEPGDTLEVKVLAIDFPIEYGYNGCAGFLPENCDRGSPAKIIWLDKRNMTAEFRPGIVVPLHPFFGSMGVAPEPAQGRVSSNPPDRHAGNLDNKELVVGSSLFIPVFVRGALFSIGDGHAAQGDGEVDQTAIETSLRGRVQLIVHKNMKLTWPRAETATDFITMAAAPDLENATKLAIQEMVDFIAATKGLTKHEAYQLTSIAANVAITQLVDKPNIGVHVKLPKSIFR